MGNTILRCCFYFGFAMSLTACEGYRSAKGVVRDKDTLQPIDSALVEVVSKDGQFYTDATGSFSVSGSFGACTFGCRDIVINISKSGYQGQTLRNPDSGDVFLQRF